MDIFLVKEPKFQFGKYSVLDILVVISAISILSFRVEINDAFFGIDHEVFKWLSLVVFVLLMYASNYIRKKGSRWIDAIRISLEGNSLVVYKEQSKDLEVELDKCDSIVFKKRRVLNDYVMIKPSFTFGLEYKIMVPGGGKVVINELEEHLKNRIGTIT